MDERKAIKTLEHHYAWLKQSWKPYPDQDVLDAIGTAQRALNKQIIKNQIYMAMVTQMGK